LNIASSRPAAPPEEASEELEEVAEVTTRLPLVSLLVVVVLSFFFFELDCQLSIHFLASSTFSLELAPEAAEATTDDRRRCDSFDLQLSIHCLVS
jgi:hypothetical protein